LEEALDPEKMKVLVEEKLQGLMNDQKKKK
jgi:hypothetical protein